MRTMKEIVCVMCLCVLIQLIFYVFVAMENFEQSKINLGFRERTAKYHDHIPRNININSYVGAKFMELWFKNDNAMNRDAVFANRYEKFSDPNHWNKVVQSVRNTKHTCGSDHTFPRRLFMMKYADDLSFVLPSWPKWGFDENGSYQRVDYNMPVALPLKLVRSENNTIDGPLSILGHMNAWLTGSLFRDIGINIRNVYSSSALKCVETANSFLLGMEKDIGIKIEPALHDMFEYNFTGVMSIEDLKRIKLNVDVDHKPLQLSMKINYTEQRCQIIEYIARKHEGDGDTLIVTHSKQMKTCIEQLTLIPLAYHERFAHVEASSFHIFQKNCDKNNKTWNIIVPTMSPIRVLAYPLHKILL